MDERLAFGTKNFDGCSHHQCHSKVLSTHVDAYFSCSNASIKSHLLLVISDMLTRQFTGLR